MKPFSWARAFPFPHRPGLAEIYVVRVQMATGEDEDAFQFNEADDAFDQVERLQADGCAAHVVRRWLLT